MASTNAFKELTKKTALYRKKYKAFFNDFCDRNYQLLIGAIAERTPVDFGVLREGWSKHSAMENQGEKIVFHIKAVFFLEEFCASLWRDNEDISCCMCSVNTIDKCQNVYPFVGNSFVNTNVVFVNKCS